MMGRIYTTENDLYAAMQLKDLAFLDGIELELVTAQTTAIRFNENSGLEERQKSRLELLLVVLVRVLNYGRELEYKKA